MRTVVKFLLLTLMLFTPLISQADILFADTHDQKTLFSDLKGKWVLVNYWASWCQTCIDEIPELNQFYKSHKKDPVALFAVNFDALSSGEQKSLIKQFKILYPNLLQDPANDLHLGDITGVPVTFLFNPQGILVKTLYGEQTKKTLDKTLYALSGSRSLS